ncbi:MAG: CPBP family intramembrane metalloprotease [Fimbriimonadaceae bacterium]|nr:CPBP family intramembrane metalloprotease [Chitinophagales bacterium]
MENKSKIYLAGFATLFCLGGVGIFLILLFQNKSLEEIFFNSPSSILFQLLCGFAYGIVTSGILVLLLRKRMLKATKVFFSDLMKRFNVSGLDILFLSFCAGVGEELFFRGAIQPWLGIWLTTILFIALHGYLNPKNKPLFIYGIVLLIVCAGFGYLMKYAGIWSAMTAHFIIDVVLMQELRLHKIRL